MSDTHTELVTRMARNRHDLPQTTGSNNNGHWYQTVSTRSKSGGAYYTRPVWKPEPKESRLTGKVPARFSAQPGAQTDTGSRAQTAADTGANNSTSDSYGEQSENLQARVTAQSPHSAFHSQAQSQVHTDVTETQSSPQSTQDLASEDGLV